MDKIFKPCTHFVEPPGPPNLNVSARGRVSKSDVERLIPFVHWGYCPSGYIDIELWERGGCSG